jgi:hypothetical protein
VVCGSAPGESFVWLSRQQLYVLVYLVTVMHSAQAGYMDKAHKYTEKALAQIDKLTCEYHYDLPHLRPKLIINRNPFYPSVIAISIQICIHIASCDL